MNDKIQKALELFKNKDYEKAIDAFCEVLETVTDNAELCNNLALSYSYVGETEQAEKFYLKALGINPKLPQIYINLADLYYKDKNLADAVAILQAATHENPENLVLKHYLARVYMEDAMMDLAIDELDKVIEGEPENYDAYYDLGRIYFEMGNYQLAIENFENVLKYKDDNELIYYYLGQAYEANDEVDKALSSHLRAITVNEAFAPAYKKVGILFLARNDFDDAIEYFEEYIKLGVPEVEINTIKATIERIKKVKGDA